MLSLIQDSQIQKILNPPNASSLWKDDLKRLESGDMTLSSKVRPVVRKLNPSEADFKTVARYYNGRGYAAYHYDESLARWFREFKVLRG